MREVTESAVEKVKQQTNEDVEAIANEGVNAVKKILGLIKARKRSKGDLTRFDTQP
jgi:hypothetical protein